MHPRRRRPGRAASLLPGKPALGRARGRCAGRLVLIEPINLRDMPGYFLHRQAQAHALLDAVQSPT